MIEKLFIDTVVNRHHEKLFTKPSSLEVLRKPDSKNFNIEIRLPSFILLKHFIFALKY